MTLTIGSLCSGIGGIELGLAHDGVVDDLAAEEARMNQATRTVHEMTGQLAKYKQALEAIAARALATIQGAVDGGGPELHAIHKSAIDTLTDEIPF